MPAAHVPEGFITLVFRGKPVDFLPVSANQPGERVLGPQADPDAELLLGLNRASKIIRLGDGHGDSAS